MALEEFIINDLNLMLVIENNLFQLTVLTLILLILNAGCPKALY